MFAAGPGASIKKYSDLAEIHLGMLTWTLTRKVPSFSSNGAHFPVDHFGRHLGFLCSQVAQVHALKSTRIGLKLSGHADMDVDKKSAKFQLKRSTFSC